MFWGSGNRVVTDRAVASKPQETSPLGPSPHGSETLEAPAARGILGEGPEFHGWAVAQNLH
eukprot:3189414-Pyramimonas_sp.AAC.1